MKHRRADFSLAIVALLTAFAAACEAAVVSPPRAPRPEERTPSGPSKGPTDNITKVMNALSMRQKSLTIQVTAKPGLQLTQPVTISISFVGAGNGRLTQDYVGATGNRLVYHDAEGDSQAREVNITITLTEPKAKGSPYTFSFFWRATVQPLYDVTVSPLQFVLNNDCDLVGTNEILFRWFYPDPTQKSFSFNASKNQSVSIAQFQWARPEVSASTKLRMPFLDFVDRDPGAFEFVPGILDQPSSPSLMPPRPEWPRTSQGSLPFPFNQYIIHPVVATVKDSKGEGCSAQTRYVVTYWLRRYESL